MALRAPSRNQEFEISTSPIDQYATSQIENFLHATFSNILKVSAWIESWLPNYQKTEDFVIPIEPEIIPWDFSPFYPHLDSS